MHKRLDEWTDRRTNRQTNLQTEPDDSQHHAQYEGSYVRFEDIIGEDEEVVAHPCGLPHQDAQGADDEVREECVEDVSDSRTWLPRVFQCDYMAPF